MQIDNIQEALLYEAEWWFAPISARMEAQDDYHITALMIEYGYGDDWAICIDIESLSFTCLLIAEAIK